MKIKNKLLLSNLMISLISIVLLASVMYYIVQSYIAADAKEQLIRENKVLVSKLKYMDMDYLETDQFGDSLFDYYRSEKLPVEQVVFGVSDSGAKLYLNTFEYVGDQQMTEIVDGMIHLENESYFDYSLKGKSLIGFKQPMEIVLADESQELYVVTLVYNTTIMKLTSQLMGSLFVILVIIGFITLMMTQYLAGKLTSPIYRLVEVTDKIAKKEQIHGTEVKTGDEYEVLANALVKMAADLEALDREQKQFYEHVSHDLKTPLTVISGYAEGISTGIFEDDQEALATISSECGKLKSRVEDLIYLSRLESNRYNFEFEELELSSIIGEVLSSAERAVLLYDLELHFEPEQDIVVRADRKKLIRLVENMIYNCMKHAASNIWVSLETKNNEAVLTVWDDGPGFDEQILRNPFTGTHEGSDAGNGIGLRIIKRIMDGHGGEAEIDNSPSGGAYYQCRFQMIDNN